MNNYTIETILSEYLNARIVTMSSGDTEKLSKYVVDGIVSDENKHYNKLLDANISIVESTYEMLSIDESDTMIKVVLDETITYKMDGIVQNECIKHDLI